VRELQDERWQPLDAHEVLAVRTHHAVPGSAFLLRDAGGVLAYSGDTGPTDRLWQVLAAQPGVRALILEVSFPNELQDLADASHHLTPATAARELQKLPRRDFPVLFTHVKPGHESDVRAQVERERIANGRFLVQGEIVEL
jgi:3',5'-cyclic-nucleotide phosphodiesterase